MKQKLIDVLGHIRHPYLFLVIAMFSCMLQFEIWSFSNTDSAAIITALVIVQVLAVSCYWFPVQAALAILVFNGIGEYAIAGYGVFTSYMMFMALLILSYKLSNRGAAAVYVAMICYTILEGVLRPKFMPAQTVLAFCAGYTLIAVLGRFFRWGTANATASTASCCVCNPNCASCAATRCSPRTSTTPCLRNSPPSR